VSDLFDAAFSVPTVIFTVALIVSAVYWLATIIGGFDGSDGSDGLDAADGAGDGLLEVLGLTSVPPAVAFSLVAVFSWFVSITAHVVLEPLGLSGPLAALVAVAAVVVSLVVGTLAASLLTRPLARIYQSVPPNDLADFVGRTCTIRTGRVDADFGQAEVADADGMTLLLEVRCCEENTLARGDHALIYAFDATTGSFEVTSVPALN
jgi:hypothetical protein